MIRTNLSLPSLQTAAAIGQACSESGPIGPPDSANDPGVNPVRRSGSAGVALANCDIELILIRGQPGSGKTTMAEVLAKAGFKHLEADMYFMVNGRYLFDPRRIQDAHQWCQNEARKALSRGDRTVVSNTFTRVAEMSAYRSMSSWVRIIEAHGKWQNVHGVPPDKLRLMAQRWEPLPSHF